MGWRLAAKSLKCLKNPHFWSSSKTLQMEAPVLCYMLMFYIFDSFCVGRNLLSHVVKLKLKGSPCCIMTGCSMLSVPRVRRFHINFDSFSRRPIGASVSVNRGREVFKSVPTGIPEYFACCDLNRTVRAHAQYLPTRWSWIEPPLSANTYGCLHALIGEPSRDREHSRTMSVRSASLLVSASIGSADELVSSLL